MQVWIGTYQLASEGKGGVANFFSRPRRNIEIRAGVRRANIKPVDRKNLKRLYAFTVHREHESPGAAEVFVLDHEDDLPAFGVVRFVAKGDGGETERYVQAAAIEVADSSYIGATSRHSYTIIGGEMTKTNPEHAN